MGQNERKIPWYGHVFVLLGFMVVFVMLPWAVYYDLTHENVCVETGVIKTVEGYTTGRKASYTIATFDNVDNVVPVVGFHKAGDKVCVKTEYLKVPTNKGE